MARRRSFTAKSPFGNPVKDASAHTGRHPNVAPQPHVAPARSTGPGAMSMEFQSNSSVHTPANIAQLRRKLVGGSLNAQGK